MIYLIIAFIFFLLSLFVPVLRKTIGLLLVILGILGTMTVIGAIFGIPMIIFGGILLFIGDNSHQVIIENKNIISIDEGGRIECPYCSELIKVTAKVCRYCSRDLPASHIKEISQKLTCPNCGNSIPPNLEHCSICDSNLFTCEECSSYVGENDTNCHFCGIQFQEKEHFRGFLKRMIANKK